MSTPNNIWASTARPSTTVTVLHDRAVLRLGEGLRRLSVIYERNGVVYVRSRDEFLRLFTPVPPNQ